MSKEVTLWTIQPIDRWEHLQEKGVLRCDTLDFSDRFDTSDILGNLAAGRFEIAYTYMAQQMRIRIPGCVVNYPIWAWFKPKPDLSPNTFKHLSSSGNLGIRIEFRAQAESVLLSHIGCWEVVLSTGYLGLSEQDCSEFQARKKLLRAAGNDDTILHEEIASWEKAFDLELLKSSCLWSGYPSIQACVSNIKLEQVVEVATYKAMH